MNYRIRNMLALLFIAAPLAGCASYLSSSRDAAANKKEGQGLAYYLPKRLITLTFDYRKKLDLADAATQLAKAEAEARANAAAIDKANAAKGNADKLVKAFEGKKVPVDSAPYLEALKQLTDAEQQVASLQADKADLQAAVTKAKSALEAAKASSEFVGQFSLRLLPMVADERARFVLRDRHVPSRSEQFTLTTTRSGLLTSVDSAATDQSSQIVVALAQSLGALKASRSPPAAMTESGGDGCVDTQTGPFTIERTLDPVDADAIREFVSTINRKFCGSTGARFQFAAIPSANAAGSTDFPDASLGIAYRRELPLVISFQTVDGHDNPMAASFLLEIPNGSPTEVLPMTANTFGTVKRKVTFDQGLLVSLDSNRDSELLKVASLPYEAVKAGVEAVSTIVQLKVNVSNNKTSLAESEKKRAEAEKALADALELIRNAKPATPDAGQ